jgi:Bacterial lectin
MRLGGLQSRLPLRWATASAVTVTALGVLCAPAFATTGVPNTGTVLYQEGFTGPDTPVGDWISKSSIGHHNPCLTAAAQPTSGGIPQCVAVASGAAKPDPDGSGVFQLTNNAKQESGYGLFTRPLQTDKGLEVDFDLFQHNAKTSRDALGTRGGDGITFFLLNGAASPATAGDAGGSLGYRNLPGGLIGLGFDEYGNFSDPAWGGKGGPGERPNSVVLRGAESTGYRYITGVKAPGPLAADRTVGRPGAKRHVTIKLSTRNMLTVYVDFLNGKGPQRVIGPIDLNTIKGQPVLPPTIKFGFAAATGAATAYHEIQGMSMTGLPPDLRLAVGHSGTFKAGQTGTFVLQVANEPSAGPTTGPATVSFRVPDGMTAQSPSGTGWQCSQGGQVVTCTRSDTLNNGAAYPPVTVPVTVAPTASGNVTVTGTVSDPNDAGTTGKTATDSVVIGAPSPDITITSTHTGNFVPGGTGTYVVNVSDKPQAGPTTGPVTVTFPVPDGLTPTTAGGDGWTCKTAASTVTCTRADVLQPGASYPPLKIGVAVPSGTAGDIPTTVTATTSDDANPQSVTASDMVTVTPLPPDLAMALTTTGPFTAGHTGTYNMLVSNRPGAGPTTGPVTATIGVPDGMTVRSAKGDGWACSISGKSVMCTRDGSGAGALAPGTAYPPVHVVVDIPNTASGQVPASATVATPGDTGQPQETSQAKVLVQALTPNVHVTITAPPVKAGDPATITLVATDDPAAGPVTGPTKVTLAIPAGSTPTSVSAPGWQCQMQGQQLTCTRGDGLPPGDSFPPVTVTLGIPATATGQLPLSATAQTDNQPAASTATAKLPIQVVPPKLAITLGDQGVFTPGQASGAYLINVSDDPSAGPVTGPVTVTFPLPAGMTARSASGDGWNCKVAGPATGQQVTCTRTSPLAPGASYPVITVGTAVPAVLSGAVPATAKVVTPGPNGDIAAEASHTLTVGQLAPQVKVAVTPPDTIKAGGTGTYSLVASDDKQAGPTTGPTTVSFTVPDGATVQSASGDGWQCTVTGQTVSCTRPDILAPGSSFPPVQVVVALPDGATGTVTSTAGVDTPGNGAASGVQASTDVPVTPLPPDPAVSVGCPSNPAGQSTATDGSIAQICVSVSDSSTAGPVTDPVTVSIPAPPGMTPGTASGNGWNCGDSNQQDGFICVDVGGVNPGASLPPINTSWNVNGDVTGTAPVTATAYTANQSSLSGSVGTGTVTETAPAPKVTTQVTTSGPAPAGGNVDMTVKVADAGTGGPTTGDVSVTVPIPGQIHPTSVYGFGWDCTTSAQDVSCRRPNGGAQLQPGTAYPDITVSGTATAPWDGGQIWATVGSS